MIGPVAVAHSQNFNARKVPIADPPPVSAIGKSGGAGLHYPKQKLVLCTALDGKVPMADIEIGNAWLEVASK